VSDALALCIAIGVVLALVIAWLQGAFDG